MRHPRITPPWLSTDMAHALTAMCPPLATTDVVQAAAKLTMHASSISVINHLLRQGADLMKVRRVVEALGALRDIHEQDFRLPA